MAYWDNKTKQIVRFPPMRVEGRPDWVEIDCGCCAGTMWGGEFPRECETCGGAGTLFFHKPSRVLALYPGGPFCGRLQEDDPEVSKLRGI